MREGTALTNCGAGGSGEPMYPITAEPAAAGRRAELGHRPGQGTSAGRTERGCVSLSSWTPWWSF